ncbi:hypothetical protein B0H11DRAFT_2251932 [Mycena galericulata]|nr:hypothetical protein B0H11DRAFT_2251932 [Mycena galericulata]
MPEVKDAAICAEGDFHETTRGIIRSPPGVASTTLRMPVDEHLTERAATLAEVFHDAVRALNPPLVQTVVIDEANTPEFWYCGGAASLRSPPMSRYVRLSGETPTAYKSDVFQQLARVSTSKVREQRIDQWRFDSYQLGTPSGWIRNVGLKSIVGALFWMESGGLDGLVFLTLVRAVDGTEPL